LFDEARKQLLPFLPQVIGVVTSPTGAVIRDILHRLADRFPRRVLVWPVRVQGEGAADEIAGAIRGFNALPVGGDIPRPDLIIVARGGGSIEDLWAFNEETVVRAAADSLIALIAAVGHETDVTLIDFAADRRAPTPTAAAEMAVPVRAELIARLDGLGQRTFACWRHGQDRRRADLRAAARALPAPDSLLGPARQRLDAAATRLPRALIAHARRHRADYAGVAGRLNRGLLRVRVAQARERLAALAARSRRGLQVRLARERARLGGAGQLLAALSYRGVLTRGFALVRGPDQRPIRSADAVSPGLRIDIEFADGRVGATADGGGRTAATRATAKPAAPPGRKRSRRPGSPEQGSLF
jgi:exodeoxyribonuclease VII large subunit